MNRITRIGLLFIFGFIYCPLYSQDKNQIEEFYKVYPNERAVVITNNSLYQNFESVLFKVFLWDGDELLKQKESNVAQIVFRDGTGKVVQQQNIMIVDGEGNGSIALDSTKSGFYSIEVYTKWMSNFTKLPLAWKSVWVTQSEQMPQGKFSSIIVKPEGGNLRAGGKQRIAVSPGVFTSSGFTIKIRNQLLETIFADSIHSFYGVVQPELSIPGSYFFELCLLDSKLCLQQTISTTDFSCLTLAELNDKTINFKIEGNDTTQRDRNFVIINQHALLKNTAVTNRMVSIDREQLPAGILHALLIEDDKIISHRAFYNSSSDVLKIDLKFLLDKGTNIQIESDDILSTVFISPSQIVVGANFIEDTSLSPFEIDSLMLFEQYAMEESLEKYLTSGALPINYFRSTSYFDKKNTFPVKNGMLVTPLNLVLGGFNNEYRVKVAITEKSFYSRIAETYNFEFETTLTSLPTDKTYTLSDYPDVKTLGHVFDYSIIPNLIRRKVDNRMELAFTYINRKGVKSTYNGKPVICVDGHIIPDIDVLRGISAGNIASVETLYSPSRIIDNGLKEFFPFGVINFRSESNALNKELLAQYPKLFSGIITWPKVFKLENTSKRIPPFYNVCSWISNYRSKQLIDFSGLEDVKYTLFFFNMELAKAGKSVRKELP